MNLYEKLKYYIFAFICFIPMIFLRDYTPGNELRYLNIVDDAINNGNFFCFHFNGEIYADKPPLYFWIMMLGKYLLGEHQMWFIAFFSIIPAFIIVWTMEKWVRISLPVILLSTALFLGSTLVLRMDMLMTMFIVLALKIFWDQYTAEITLKGSLLLGFFVFMAIFAKGPFGIIIPLISTLVYSLINKDIKKWLHVWNWKVWLVIIILFMLWMIGVYNEGGYEYINNLLFHQTVDRGINSFKHSEPFYYYLLHTLWDLLPWTPLCIFIAYKCIRLKWQLSGMNKYFLTIILTTFVVLSIVSSKTEVYMLPIYPFIIYLMLEIYSHLIYIKACRDRWDFMGAVGVMVLALCFVAGLCMPFINPYIGFKDLSEEAVRLNNIYHYDKFYGLELHRCVGMKYYDESLDVELVLAQDTIQRDYSHSIVLVDERAKERGLSIPTDVAIDSSKVGKCVIYVVE